MINTTALTRHIQNSNNFDYIKKVLIDIQLNGLKVKNKKVNTIEDYLSIVDILDTSTYDKEKTKELISTIKNSFYKLQDDYKLEMIIAFTEIYCIYALYPKKVAQELKLIKDEFYKHR